MSKVSITEKIHKTIEYATGISSFIDGIGYY